MVRRVIAAGALAAALLSGGGPVAYAQDARCAGWMDKAKSPSQRADALVAAMTQEQKLHMLTFGDPPWFTYFGTAGHVAGIDELCVPDLVLSDAGSGVAGLQVNTTVFPSGVVQASTWDTQLQRRFGKALGEEAYGKGINVMLGPGMNIARTPLNGRTFEYFGEDPYLTGRTATAVIRGIQENPVLANAKHYAANNQETDRNSVDAIVDQRTLREIYLPAFEAAVKDGEVGSVMCSYNKLNGPYACENPTLLTRYLRDDWGFEGFVVSDWGAVHSTAESAVAGLDLEMNAVGAPVQFSNLFGAGGKFFGAEQLQAAVDAGKLPQARIDAMVKDVVRPMFRFGLFDAPVRREPEPFLNDVATPEHRALAREVGAEGTVLLKNRDALLPFPKGSGRTIAVIGYAANPVGATNSTSGGGSSRGSGVPPTVSPLQGITQLAAAYGDRVVYADGSQGSDAEAVARAADLAVVVATDGLSEGTDRPDLGLRPSACATLFCSSLPLDQEQMIASTVKANPRTTVVLDVGAPVRMPWLKDAGAVLLPWYGGVEHGNTLASVLYGELEPGGRLPQTFPVDERQTPLTTKQQYPGVDKKAEYSEGLLVGYRWFDAKDRTPLFPFGFGLGYTTFAFEDLAVAKQGDGATATFTVRNTGKRAGKAVPQVYVTDPATTGEPPLQLKGFRALRLDPGEAQRVTLNLDARAFSQWSEAARGWRVARGCYDISVGSSSRDLPLSATLPMGGTKRCGTPPTVCASRRAFTIRLPRAPQGAKVRRTTVTVAGTRVRVRRAGGRQVATVDLRGTPRRAVVVKIRQRLSTGRLVTTTRRFRPCTVRPTPR